MECYSCNQPRHFKRVLTGAGESRSLSPRPRAPLDTNYPKRVQFLNKPITITRRVVPSVRAGAKERGENAWHIPVSINGMVVDAMVDTAAEITIISQRVYESLTLCPGGVEEMNVRITIDGTNMTASFLGELEIGINEYRCPHLVYVAALQDSMLLGIDLLQANHICLSYCSEEFWFNGCTESNRMHKPKPEVRVIAVSVKRLRVPTLSAHVIEHKLNAKLGHFLSR